MELDDINVLVFLDDEGYDWCMVVNKSINLLWKKNILVVVVNIDVVYFVFRGELVMVIGGLVEMIEKIVNKNFIYFGKLDG